MEKFRKIDVDEVIPPGARSRASGEKVDDPLVETIARLMDAVFTIPGTKIRFGLDPLIGLVPGIGASLSSVVSLFLIIRSARYRLPHLVLARMALNVLINGLLDAIPVAGDALSIFFRSNARNYELLKKHAGSRKTASRHDWLIVGMLLASVIAALALTFIGFLWVLAHAWSMISPHP